MLRCHKVHHLCQGLVLVKLSNQGLMLDPVLSGGPASLDAIRRTHWALVMLSEFIDVAVVSDGEREEAKTSTEKPSRPK